MNPEGAVARLAERRGVEFPHLAAARVYSAERLDEARQKLAGVALDDVSVVLFGSGARGELTDGSDNDWAILTPAGREADDDVVALAAQCRGCFNDDGKAPGSQDVFGVPFAWPDLPEFIGLNEDSNTNLTRRMLTLLESVAVTGGARDDCWHAVLERYRRGVKDHWPPRFLLNDTIRYWRTICVDFEGKHRDSGGDDPKWVMRNAKLRTSRKLLFASGLLPVLFCRLREIGGDPGLPGGRSSPLGRQIELLGRFLSWISSMRGRGAQGRTTNGSACFATRTFARHCRRFAAAPVTRVPSSLG